MTTMYTQSILDRSRAKAAAPALNHNQQSLNGSLRSPMLRAVSRAAYLAGFFVLASLPAFANIVPFSGYQFSSLYGPDTLIIDGSGHLQVTVTSSNFGGAFSLLPNGTTFMTTSFLDSGSTSGPAAELWVQDFTNPLVYEAAVGAFTGNLDYDFEYRVDGVSGTFLSTGIARTAGIHTASIAQLSNGAVDFFLDGTLVGSADTSQFGIPALSDVVLTANGDAVGELASFTSFAATPEPSYLACLIGLFAPLAFMWKRKQRSAAPHGN